MSSQSTCRMIVLLISSMLLAACSQAAGPAKTVVVVTATPSLTPVPPTATVTPTPWLEEVHPTATPLPTLTADEIFVTVVPNDSAEITRHDRHFRALIESNSGSLEPTVEDNIVQFLYMGYCGDECSYTSELKLRHIDNSELPEFVSFLNTRNDYYEGTNQKQLTGGQIVIDQWDIEGIVSGRILSSMTSSFVFWHDFSQQTLLSQFLAGKAISAEALRDALKSEDINTVRDALLIINKKSVYQQVSTYSLIPDLLELVADTRRVSGEFFYLGNEATFTLSELASVKDGIYFANREPLAYTFYEFKIYDEVPPAPSAERIAEVQDNWLALFESLNE